MSEARWRRTALGGGAGMFVGMGLGRFSYSAMVPALVEAGEVSAVAAGRIGMVNLAGFFIGAVLSVPLAGWLGRGRVLRLALVMALAGLAASALPWGVAWLTACRGLIGVATSLVMVLALALIAETAPVEKRAAAAGFVFAGVGLGIVTSGVVVPLLLARGLGSAWLGIFLGGLLAAALALWGWAGAPDRLVLPKEKGSYGKLHGLRWLLVAHALFSFGIVPHTLYWVDFLVRGVGLGASLGGTHWVIVGVFAVLGPLATTLLARGLGIAWALVIAFVVLAIGVGLPGLIASTTGLIASSMIFGAQPGLSSLMAARARELSGPEAMNSVMRLMIIANALGGVAGGLIVPWVFGSEAFGAAGDHAPLFLLGAAALAAGAVVTAWPRRDEARAAK